MPQVRSTLRLMAVLVCCMFLGIIHVLGIFLELANKLNLTSRKARLFRARCMALLFRIFTKSIRIDIKTDLGDMKSLPDENFLLLANHVNYLDIIVLAAIHPLGFVAKSEIESWPGLGPIIKAMNTIFVERDSMWGRIRCIRDLEAGLKHTSYCIFPEGTTSDKDAPALDLWKHGNIFAVKKERHRIFTAAIRYEDHKEMAWIDDMELLPHLWKTLQKKRILVSIRIRELKYRKEDTENLRALSLKAHESVCISAESLKVAVDNSHHLSSLLPTTQV